MFRITNLKTTEVSFGKSCLGISQYQNVTTINADVVAAKNAGLVSITFTPDTAALTTTLLAAPTALTDSSTGTAGNTIAAITAGAAYAQADAVALKNAVASLSAKVNLLIVENAKYKSIVEHLLQTNTL